MANIIKSYKCPFLESTKFCTHKGNGFPTKFHRKVCGHKNCVNCELFLEWQKELHINQKGSLRCS